MEKNEALYTGMVLSPCCKSIYLIVQKKINSETNCTKKNHFVLSSPFRSMRSSVLRSPLPCRRRWGATIASVGVLCPRQPLACHPSCPMTSPIKDHHQNPCACSASEYVSSFPSVESSLLEVHRHVSSSIPCQKA